MASRHSLTTERIPQSPSQPPVTQLFLARRVAGTRIALAADVFAAERKKGQHHDASQTAARRAALPLMATFFVMLATGCGGVTGASSSGNGSGTPPPVSISLSAASTSVLLGATTTLIATVSNTTNTAVTWTVNGVAGGNAQIGTISAGGLFTAPVILPSSPSVTIQAASVADPTRTASVNITIVSDINVTLAPPNPSIELGAQQIFQASITSAGNPSSAVTWALSSAGCSGSACGSVSSNGLFTAPQDMPSPATETVTATSVADPSKKATASITITSNFSFTLSGPASLTTGTSTNLTATLTPVPNSNPDLAISWSVAGAGCSNAACGTLVPGNSGATASFTAPAAVPSPNVVTVTATPAAAPQKAVSLAIQISYPSNVTVSLAPATATLSLSNRQTFTAQVQNASNTGVAWSVAGVAGGNTTVGQICVVGSNPCQSVTSANAGSVDYVAPPAVPSPNPVTLSAVSQANPTASASSSVTLIPHVVVSVSPPSATLAPNSNQNFSAAVAGTSNQQVTWTVAGTACSAPGLPCGTIDATGLYHAPATAPTPNSFSVVATSAADNTQTGVAAVTITANPAILSLLPSSITAGAAGGFTLDVQGANFIPTGTGTGSTILIGGGARTTSCTSASDCSTPLSTADLAVSGNLSVAIQNSAGNVSNAVAFVVVPPTGPAGNIALTPGAPTATGKDIVVTDLSTNGSSLPSEDVSLSVAAIGIFQSATDACSLNGGPVTAVPPASGQSTFSICAFSVAGLAPSYLYSLSGPSPNDMSIVSEAPLGLGIVDLAIQFSSTTVSGVRTLFIQNASLDEAAATGAIDVQ